MDAILQGLSGIFEVVLIAGLGFYLAKTGWLWETAGKDLTRLTMTVSLPPLMIYSLKSNFTHDQLIETAPDLLLPFASIFAAYLAGRLLAAILHISPRRRGVFTCTCCIANAIFIGLPVNVALFGEKSVPSAMLYYIANTAMFWGLGAYLIVKDAGSGRTFTFGEMMKKPHAAAHGIRGRRGAGASGHPPSLLCLDRLPVCGKYGHPHGSYGGGHPDE